MDADERESSERTSFLLALRRGDVDARPEPKEEPGRRLDFIPILSPVVVEDRDEPRLRARARRLVPGLLAVVLIGALTVSIGRGRREHDAPPAQDLAAGVPRSLEPSAPFYVGAARVPQEDGSEVAPRTVRVAVRSNRKDRSDQGPRRARVTLAGYDDSDSKPAGSGGRTGSKSSDGNKSSSTTTAKAPPQPGRSLYHLYKGGNRDDHWFTISATERDERIERGYELVAVEGLVFGREEAGAIPLNTDNGVAGFIYEEPRDGYVPLYMFRGYNGYGDLFTSDEARIPEYEEQGWNPYGIVGYVLPAP